MKIILYNADIKDCKAIEISTDGKNIIIDGTEVIPLIEVLRIVEG